jgi:hypothetical protein
LYKERGLKSEKKKNVNDFTEPILGGNFPDFPPPIKWAPTYFSPPLLSDRQIVAINDNGLESLILMTRPPLQYFPIPHGFA